MKSEAIGPLGSEYDDPLIVRPSRRFVHAMFAVGLLVLAAALYEAGHVANGFVHLL